MLPRQEESYLEMYASSLFCITPLGWSEATERALVAWLETVGETHEGRVLGEWTTHKLSVWETGTR